MGLLVMNREGGGVRGVKRMCGGFVSRGISPFFFPRG